MFIAHGTPFSRIAVPHALGSYLSGRGYNRGYGRARFYGLMVEAGALDPFARQWPWNTAGRTTWQGEKMMDVLCLSDEWMTATITDGGNPRFLFNGITVEKPIRQAPPFSKSAFPRGESVYELATAVADDGVLLGWIRRGLSQLRVKASAMERALGWFAGDQLPETLHRLIVGYVFRWRIPPSCKI